MAFTKPNVNRVWAATGTSIAPTNSKIDQGWVVEIPDFEFENFIQNRQDQFNAHVNQYGIPVWDAATEYQANKSYVQGSDGFVYKALTTNTNQDPVTQPTQWVRAFNEFDYSYSKTAADSRFLNSSDNLSDLGSTATARTNLNVYSKTESDARYLDEANNLSDLDDTPTARTNLGVYGTTEVYNKTESDARYVDTAGDTMTGKLTLDGDPTLALHAAPRQYVDAAANPIGSVIQFAASTPPTGYLKCDGAEVSRTTYAALYAVVGDVFGAGNGTSTFNLPDLRGEFIRGWDDGRGIDTGRTFGSFQLHTLESHSHTASTGSAGNHNHTGSTSTTGNHAHQQASHFRLEDTGWVNINGYTTLSARRVTSQSSTSYTARRPNVSNAGNHNHSLSINSNGSHTHSVTVNATGGSETRPRNIALLYCIKF